MCTVYLLSPETKLRLAGARLVVERGGERLRSLLLSEVSCAVAARCATLTTPALFALFAQGAAVFFVDGRGQVVASVNGSRVSLGRARVQYAAAEDAGRCLALARGIVGRKIDGQRQLLKGYAKSRRDANLSALAAELLAYRRDLRGAVSTDEVRGFEGMASRRYFSGFARILDQNIWPWQGRSRRPPRDAVNALLSYGYAFLERETRIALLGAGLDERVGFLHANNGRKDSLVFDLMEPFRPLIVDHFVLRALNRGEFRPEEFTFSEEAGCRLSDAARGRFIARFEEYLAQAAKEREGLCPRDFLRLSVRTFGEELLRTATAC